MSRCSQSPDEHGVTRGAIQGAGLDLLAVGKTLAVDEQGYDFRALMFVHTAEVSVRLLLRHLSAITKRCFLARVGAAVAVTHRLPHRRRCVRQA